jgi:hypothetical protein
MIKISVPSSSACVRWAGARKGMAIPAGEFAALRDHNGNPVPDSPEARRVRRYYEQLVPTLPDEEDRSGPAAPGRRRYRGGIRPIVRPVPLPGNGLAASQDQSILLAKLVGIRCSKRSASFRACWKHRCWSPGSGLPQL